MELVIPDCCEDRELMPSRKYFGGHEGDESGRVDGLLRYKDLGNHLYGEFSMVVVQDNSSLEDRGELESRPLSSNHLGPQGTFIGVYDGHDGSEAS